MISWKHTEQDVTVVLAVSVVALVGPGGGGVTHIPEAPQSLGVMDNCY